VIWEKGQGGRTWGDLGLFLEEAEKQDIVMSFKAFGERNKDVWSDEEKENGGCEEILYRSFV
jgi:hypothetical protein